MFKELKTLIICFAILNFTLIESEFRNAYGQSTESEAAAMAADQLVYMSKCAQEAYQFHSGTSMYFPGFSCNAGSPCWESPSITGSTEALYAAFSGVCTVGLLLSVDCEAIGGGDVRFRCRNQRANLGSGGEVYCFAYRCEQTVPAGCKQKWRLMRKVGASNPVTCTDVGANDGVCPQNPSDPTCPVGCKK